MLAINSCEYWLGPSLCANDGRRQVVSREPTGISALERMDLDLSPDRPTEEQQRIERNP
jgi:hypothetical protein